MTNRLYTDGSCIGNPGRGGWAAKCLGFFEITGGSPKTTNNIMEMTAVIEGLRKCYKCGIRNIAVYTDSFYVRNGIKSWIHKWKLNNWKTSSGSDVKNKELWVQMDSVSKLFDNIDWIWVKAHNGDPDNEYVDQEARRIANSFHNSV